MKIFYNHPVLIAILGISLVIGGIYTSAINIPLAIISEFLGISILLAYFYFQNPRATKVGKGRKEQLERARAKVAFMMYITLFSIALAIDWAYEMIFARPTDCAMSRPRKGLALGFLNLTATMIGAYLTAPISSNLELLGLIGLILGLITSFILISFSSIVILSDYLKGYKEPPFSLR